MRYGAEHKQQTRERVLKEAARAIRLSGPHQVGVAEVMAKAGLTHGGFYAHFKSREDLVAAAVGQMFEDSRAALELTAKDQPPAGALNAYLDFYLSARHRDSRSSGCPLPYLAADAPRLAEPIRERFARGVEGLRASLATKLAAHGIDHPDSEAASMLAELVGAVSLARAEPDRDRSDAILATSKAAIRRRYNLESES
jgi:TetR/AcrR family transcriptional regulator, transcriptional repressor for nem operon